MAVKQIQAQENIAPNLIPMVDIMFLLLLFFMLGADMGQRELEDVKLPVATDVREDKDTPNPKDLPRVNVNVFHDVAECPNYKGGDGICVEESHWQIGIHGVAYTPDTLKPFMQQEADLDRNDANNLAISGRRVMIRADAAALYGYVQKVMNVCAEVGIYKVEIGAAQQIAPGTVGE